MQLAEKAEDLPQIYLSKILLGQDPPLVILNLQSSPTLEEGGFKMANDPCIKYPIKDDAWPILLFQITYRNVTKK